MPLNYLIYWENVDQLLGKCIHFHHGVKKSWLHNNLLITHLEYEGVVYLCFYCIN